MLRHSGSSPEVQEQSQEVKPKCLCSLLFAQVLSLANKPLWSLAQKAVAACEHRSVLHSKWSESSVTALCLTGGT